MEIKKIKGVVKDYAWGNSDFIPSLIGGKASFSYRRKSRGTSG